MTADELLLLRDDTARHELVRGRLVSLPFHGMVHGMTTAKGCASVGGHLESSGCGGDAVTACGLILERDPDTVLAPDLAYIAPDRYAALGPTRHYWPEAPALAIEVLEEGEDAEGRAAEWLRAGSQAVLMLDPEQRTATVHGAGDEARTCEGEAEIDLADVVPGWRPTLEELLA